MTEWSAPANPIFIWKYVCVCTRRTPLVNVRFKFNMRNWTIFTTRKKYHFLRPDDVHQTHRRNHFMRKITHNGFYMRFDHTKLPLPGFYLRTHIRQKHWCTSWQPWASAINYYFSHETMAVAWGVCRTRIHWGCDGATRGRGWRTSEQRHQPRWLKLNISMHNKHLFEWENVLKDVH